MDDSVQCWSNPRINYFKIRHLSCSYRWRRSKIIHWINELHFFDPQHTFRNKLWTSTYVSLDSFLPTIECCWLGELVKMRIWNLQSLLVYTIFLWKSSLTWDDWISGWRSWLASLILNWFLACSYHMWCWVLWYIRDPCARLLRISCRRRRRWICTKTFPDVPRRLISFFDAE